MFWIRLNRRIGVFLILMAAIGCAAVPPELRVIPRPASLPLVCREVIRLAPDGTATMERIISVPPSPLRDLYAEYSKELEKPEVREDFLAQLKKQYYILLGIPLEAPLIAPPPMALLAIVAQPVELKATASIPGLARFDPEQKVWRVAVGPQVKETQDMAVHEQLSSMIFRSLYLESLPGEQRFELHREVRFELPSGARLRNAEELRKLRWNVDFGRGTYLRGSLRVEERAVVLVEELVQTELAVKLPFEPDLFARLATYGIFTILYELPVVTPIPIPPKPPVIPPGNWSGDWSVSVSPGTLSTTISHTGGSSIRVTATPSLYFGAHLGWEFRPWWEGGGLRKFEAWIDVNPSFSASATFDILTSLTWEKSVTLWSRGWRFWFWVDLVPVWINLTVEISADGTVEAGARTKFTCSASAGSTNRLGAKWERGPGWSRIVSRSPWASSPTFTVTIGAAVTGTAGPGLKLAAYVYDVAGPFVKMSPYLKGRIRTSPKDWTLWAGFKASGGVELAGWLRSLLGGLGSYSADFYTWETTLSTGTW